MDVKTGSKMSGVLWDRRISSKVKGNIHEMVIQPAMLYATKTLTMDHPCSNMTDYIQFFNKMAEMKVCRRAYVDS